MRHANRIGGLVSRVRSSTRSRWICELAPGVLVLLATAAAAIGLALAAGLPEQESAKARALQTAVRDAQALGALREARQAAAPDHRHAFDDAVDVLLGELEASVAELDDPEASRDAREILPATLATDRLTARLVALALADGRAVAAGDRRATLGWLAPLLAVLGASAIVAFALSVRAQRDRARIDRAVPCGRGGEGLATRVERLTGRVEHARSQQVRLVGERLELARVLAECEMQERQLEREVLENRERIERLEVAQMRDELTGALNFRYFLMRLNQALDDFIASERPFCLVALDLDDFKGINDGFGHHVGDAALKEFASLLHRSVRDNDIVFRKSGDEFYVLLPDATPEQGEALGARLVELVNGHQVVYDGADERYAVRLGTSAGILHCGQVDPHLLGSLRREQLLSETYGFADAALFKAKFSGKGCARIYTTGLTVAGVNPREHPPDFDALQRALRSRYPLLPKPRQDAFNAHISACLTLLSPDDQKIHALPVVDCTEGVQ